MKISDSTDRPCVIMTRFTFYQLYFLEPLFRLFTQGCRIAMLERIQLVIAWLHNLLNDVGVLFMRDFFKSTYDRILFSKSQNKVVSISLFRLTIIQQLVTTPDHEWSLAGAREYSNSLGSPEKIDRHLRKRLQRIVEKSTIKTRVNRALSLIKELEEKDKETAATPAATPTPTTIFNIENKLKQSSQTLVVQGDLLQKEKRRFVEEEMEEEEEVASSSKKLCLNESSSHGGGKALPKSKEDTTDEQEEEEDGKCISIEKEGHGLLYEEEVDSKHVSEGEDEDDDKDNDIPSDLTIDHHPQRDCEYYFEQESSSGETCDQEEISKVEWINGDLCVSKKCRLIKEKTQNLKSSPGSLSDMRLLALNDVYIFDKDTSVSITKYFKLEDHNAIVSTLNANKYRPEPAIKAHKWCQNVVDHSGRLNCRKFVDYAQM